MPKSRRFHRARVAALALALGLAGLAAAGCTGMGRPQMPLTQSAAQNIARTLSEVDAADPGQIRNKIDGWKKELEKISAEKKPDAVRQGMLRFFIGYAQERDTQYAEAVASYKEVRGDLAAQAAFRAAEIELLAQHDRNAAMADYSGVTRSAAFGSPVKVWVRTLGAAEPAVINGLKWPSALASSKTGALQAEPGWDAAEMRIDLLRRQEWRYQAVSKFVSFLGGNQHYSYALALILIAVAVKLLTWPLTSSSFRAIRAMQSLQPLIKELQEKHKGDRQALAAEQMRLFKKYKINPLGGCLPMLIQMPILIGVYYAIQLAIYQFRDAEFLWIKHLAGPDRPLLLLYAVSLYVSQKLTTIPQADPQQQQMQNTMAIMMPLMLVFVFQGIASAFLLYWFAYNVLITAHQYYLMRQPAPLLEAAKTGESPPPGKGRPRRRRKRY